MRVDVTPEEPVGVAHDHLHLGGIVAVRLARRRGDLRRAAVAHPLVGHHHQQRLPAVGELRGVYLTV